MTVSDILNAAADLIEPEGCWTQGAYARAAGGHVTPHRENTAVCFCAAGAIYRATDAEIGMSPPAIAAAFEAALDAMGVRRISEFNDAPGRTQAEVVAALRKAAKGSAS